MNPTHAYVVQPGHVVDLSGGIRADAGSEIALTEGEAQDLGAAVQRKAGDEPAPQTSPD